ncbi:SDR family oxidoreductase [Aquimarina sp. MMG015]|uniref:SDR family oxidoreductase n=1 Tax=unclassified Aquimarina TaxID=2627091 RepID=UPI000E46F60E|nr:MULTISPECIES: SDR family oxidoreductase [unclassified Aquimarina]AXT54486.1 SDR family oxidoreductase [Aquimarina sp. AD1]MBQ4804664.1 SDR family oxidoreductase [Aquimarina sp. MMG015]RKN02943.1 SDR family NAD(P)-dependent oxidoreductase [Aquimarina sp. AD1]
MKTVLITGSSNGFGYLSALTLARNGHRVWATMRDINGKNRIKKEELEKIALEEKISITIAELDVTSDKSTNDLVARILTEEKSGLDVLVNNAGVMYVGITEAYSIKQAQEQFDTNFFGVIRTSKAFLPFLKKSSDGLIVNISSLAGRLVFPYFGIYCASKFALEAYSQSLKYELKPMGVDVSVIEPGPYPSGLLYSGPEEEDKTTLESYGEMANVPKAMLQNFDQFYKSDESPNPQEIPNAILKVVEMEKGNRPIRQAVGVDYNTNELNSIVSPIQENLIKEALQMEHLI